MTTEEYIRSILECDFAGFKEEIIYRAVTGIYKLVGGADEWISYDQQKPAISEWCFITYRPYALSATKQVEFAYYNKELDNWTTRAGYMFANSDEADAHVVAWMLRPLPEPYSANTPSLWEESGEHTRTE